MTKGRAQALPFLVGGGFDKTVEFTYFPEAEQYRETLLIKKDRKE